MKKYLLIIIRKLDLYKYWVAFREDYYPTSSIKKMRAFYGDFIMPNMLCFDIGANMGNRISIFLFLKAKVVAVEPQKSCLKFLNERFTNRAVIISKGVSNKVGVQNLFVSDQSLLSSFSKDWIGTIQDKFGHHNWDQVEQVEMTTLDQLIEQYGKPDFIKIDVEGYEFEVLSGLSSSVKRLSFEYTYPEQTNGIIECLIKLQSIMPSATYNYSKGETFEFVKKSYITAPELISEFRSGTFQGGGSGDIYMIN